MSRRRCLIQIITNSRRLELKRHGTFAFPLLVSREWLKRYEAGSFMWHWHPEVEITRVLSGEMRYSIHNQTFVLKQGQALFGNENTLHSGEMLNNKDCAYVSITFDPRIIYGFSDSLIGQKYVDPIVRDIALPAVHLDGTQPWHADAIAHLDALIKAHDAAPPCYEMEMAVCLMQFWRLLCLNRPAPALISRVEQSGYTRIRAMVQFIQEHYAQKLTLSRIAAHVHLCRSECSRLFSQYMHISLFEYILGYRIERSVELLSDPALSIADIAAQCGFNDPNYFTKVFTRFKGCSPTRFRKAGGTQTP